MSNNGDILLTLIDEDFGTKGNNRWFRSEERSSLVIDYEKGIFYYNKKNIVGDPLVYLTKIRGLSFRDARDYLQRFNYIGTHVYTINTIHEDIVVYPKLVDVFMDLGRDKDKRVYFYNRGLTDETIDRFQLGWYNDFNVIPFFEEGTFRNFQMRKDSPRLMKSYYKGVGPLLFNSDYLKLTDKIYIAEGPIDAMILIQNGLPAISTGIIKPEWMSRFIRQEVIYILFDNDQAGMNEAKRVAKVLGENRCKVYCFWGEDEKYDPVDFFRDGRNKEELLELIDKESKYSFELESKK